MADIHFRPIPPRHTRLWPRQFCDRRIVFHGDWTTEAKRITCLRCLRLLADIGASRVLEIYPEVRDG